MAAKTYNISENLELLAQNKQAIKDAIIAKGGTITDSTPLSEYATQIESLPSGGGGDSEQNYRIRLFKNNEGGEYVSYDDPKAVEVIGDTLDHDTRYTVYLCDQYQEDFFFEDAVDWRGFIFKLENTHDTVAELEDGNSENIEHALLFETGSDERHIAIVAVPSDIVDTNFAVGRSFSVGEE